jgi:hypothetical protein
MRTNLTRNPGRKACNLRRSGFTCLKQSLLLLVIGWAAAFVVAQEIFAQGQPASAGTPQPEGNRFLFIVDTSAKMQQRSLEVRQLLVDLFASSANGQIHAGDTLGLWTFNADVHTGGLPVLRWIPGNEWQVAARMADFLQHQHYGKKSHFDAALADMYQIIKMSDVITVVVISDGQGTMRGTPFDADINAAYKRCLKETKHSHMPVVTVLLAKAGKITKYSVTSLPWPVTFPEVPPAEKPQVAQKPATKSATSAKPAANKSAAPPVKMLPPLIIEGPSIRSSGQSPARTTETPAQPAPSKAARQTNATTNAAAIAPAPVEDKASVVRPQAVAPTLRSPSASSPGTQAVAVSADSGHSSGFFALVGLAIVIFALALVSLVRRSAVPAPASSQLR